MKSKFRKLGLPLLLMGAISIIIYACSKNDSANPKIPEGQQRLSIMLTDDPGLFDQVMLDIRKVEIQVDTCRMTGDDSNGRRGRDDDDDDWDDDNRCGWWEDWRGGDDECKVWDSLGINPGVYDVLQLRNGVDTSLAVGNVRQGKIKKIRITLGSENSLVKDGVSYPLRSVNGQVKIVINVRHDEWDEISPDNLQLWLDFDVQRSIVKVSHGKFILKPVIHVWTIRRTGAVEGQVLPADAQSIVTVYNSLDSMYAIPGRNGYFKVRGLKAGTYSLYVNAGNGYQDTTINDIQVEAGRETEIPTINLHQ